MGKEFCLHVGAVALCTAGNEAEVKVGNVDFLYFFNVNFPHSFWSGYFFLRPLY